MLDTYTGAVTVKKDGAAWSDSGKIITLSTSSTDAQAGKLSAFTDLDPRVAYYVWADGVYTGLVLSRAWSVATVDYYSVSVTKPNTTVTEEGVYLAGSSVPLTATPSSGFDFMGWYSGSTLLSTDTTYTVNHISSKLELITEVSNTFSAMVSLSGASGRDIKLSTSSASLTDAVSGTGSGPYTFSGLSRSTTYYVFDGSTNTGKTVAKDAPNATLRYYTVALNYSTGISSVSGGGPYLEGSTANISAVVEDENVYAFNGWSGTVSVKNQASTISNISKDYALTAETYMKYSEAPIDISSGSITILDSSISGKLKVVQGSKVFDGIDPSQAIKITGTSTTDENYNVKVNAVNGATLILQDLNISINRNSPTFYQAMDISTSGNVTLILSGTNTLNANGAPAVALFKEGEGTLTIQSIDGTPDHILYATGTGACSVGIGNVVRGNVESIIINSGTVIANGPGAGIGAYGGTISGITINGGSITAQHIGSAPGFGGTLSDVTINGGALNVKENFSAGTTSNIVFNGGSLNATNIGTAPTNASSNVYKVTLSTGLQNADVSQSLTIACQDGSLYGTKDMWTTDDASGNVYLWLPNGTYTATQGTSSKTFTVNGGACSAPLQPILGVNTPVSTTTEGVTASVSLSPSANMTAGDTITATVALSGTALKPGTYTVGLTGTGIGTVATQNINVTKDQTVSTNKSFTFTMAASNVSDLAVTLSFVEMNKHTVSFMDGTKLLGSAAYYEGENYTLMDGSSLQKTGYTFGGWGVTGTQTMSTADVTHTAVWTPNTYKVVFHNDSTTTEQSFTYNAAAAALNGSFTKTGYSLSGWATTLNGPKVYNVGASVQNLSSVTNGTVDLYAVWQAQPYTVSFTNGGGTGTMAAQSFTHGVAQELTPNALTRTGYTFTGWKEGTTTYVNGQSVSATANMNLTAQWTPNSYTVVFKGNGANGGTPMSSQSFTYDESEKALTANGFTRTGYTFMGWNTKADGSGTPFTATQNVKNLTAVQNGTVTLYAVWTPNTYTVSFSAGTGSGTMNNQTHAYDTALALPDNTYTRLGYSFSGWNTKTDGSGLSYPNKASVKNLTADNGGTVTLYAMWTSDTYSLAFNSSGGVGVMDHQNFATGDSYTVSANRFEKPGYTFIGWNTKEDGNGTNYSAAAALMSLDNLNGANPTLYARWTANSYIVAFNANGGANSMSNQSFTYDVPQTLTANVFSRTGYTFLGWATSPMAETATYTNGQSVSNLTDIANGAVTLYAVWKANTYVVSFDGNGGSGDMLQQTIVRSAATALSANSYNRTGYTFVKWNTEPDGSGLFYADKQTVTNLPGDTASSITLYAQWTENAHYNLSGTVKDSNDALLSGATVKLMKGSTIVAQTKSGADGSYFIGNLNSGIYNLVASKDGKTVTTLVTIASDTIQNVAIPAAAANNSVLVVTNEPKVETPAPELTVGGLDHLADAVNADITMTVTAKAENKDSAEQLAIKAITGSQAVGMYLDMTVKKGNDTLENTDIVLEIVVPFNFSGKTTVKVLRYHAGAAEELEQLKALPTGNFVDKTCYLDMQSGLIHVYTSKFSTYAVSYTSLSGGSGSSTTTFPVNIASSNSTGSSVKPDKTTAVPGDKVTITIMPGEGYKLTGLSIIDASGKEITYTSNSNGTYTFTMPNSVVTVMPVFGNAESDFPFMDVPETHWAYGDISWVHKNGLMNGTGDGTAFEPNADTTRGMIVTVLWRMEGKPAAAAKAAFPDVTDGSYYAEAIAWAAEHKIVFGYDSGKFGPNDKITREQMVAILWRYAINKGYDVSVGERTSILSYSDAGSVSKYAVPSVQWACGAGLINGSDGKLMPQSNAARCQVAAMLHRFCISVAK